MCVCVRVCVCACVRVCVCVCVYNFVLIKLVANLVTIYLLLFQSICHIVNL